MKNYPKTKILMFFSASKQNKFGIKKFININNKELEDSNKININNSIEIENKCIISNSKLNQKENNSRYNDFITLFYFTISPVLIELKILI